MYPTVMVTAGATGIPLATTRGARTAITGRGIWIRPTACIRPMLTMAPRFSTRAWLFRRMLILAAAFSGNSGLRRSKNEEGDFSRFFCRCMMLARMLSLLTALLFVSSSAVAQDVAPPAASQFVVPPRPLPTLHLYEPAPPYLILRQVSGGVAQPTVGHPYAYGWFGVAPRRHTIVHYGYHGGRWTMPGRIAP